MKFKTGDLIRLKPFEARRHREGWAESDSCGVVLNIEQEIGHSRSPAVYVLIDGQQRLYRPSSLTLLQRREKESL